jgi:hypothetical protein
MASRWPFRRAVRICCRPPHPSPIRRKDLPRTPLLDDAAIKLEADLKDEAGTVEKPVIALRKDADASLRTAIFRALLTFMCKSSGVAPNDAQAWQLLAHLWLKIRPPMRMTAAPATSGQRPPPISPISGEHRCR